jgi:hypothetical protein
MTSGTQITVHFARPKCGLGYKATQENVLGNNAGRFERFITSLMSIRGRAFFITPPGRPSRSSHCACDLTQTPTSGLSEALGVNPQEAEFSLRNVAAFLPGPQ